jgi:alpha-methylacyl-CoA racemase
LFRSQPRAHWDALLGGTDVCYAPVLSVAEAARHPHNVARGIFIERPDGTLDVAGAPRFSDALPSEQ